MSKKTMTIHEFMEIQRIKEFNGNRKKDINRQVLIIIALIAVLMVFNYLEIDLSNNTATAFLWSELQC